MTHPSVRQKEYRWVACHCLESWEAVIEGCSTTWLTAGCPETKVVLARLRVARWTELDITSHSWWLKKLGAEEGKHDTLPPLYWKKTEFSESGSRKENLILYVPLCWEQIYPQEGPKQNGKGDLLSCGRNQANKLWRGELMVDIPMPQS